MPITQSDIAKVAQLAHLELGEEELKTFGPQIAEIVAYVEQLNELDTANVEPAIGGLTPEGEQTDSSRADEIDGSLGQKTRPRRSPRPGRRPLPRPEGVVRQQTMSRQTVEFSVTAAERLNETLNAFLQIDREGALERAAEIEKSGRAGPLAGMPIAVKDNICVRGMQASCGSKILGDYHPPYNATVIERLTRSRRRRHRQDKLRRVCDGLVE